MANGQCDCELPRITRRTVTIPLSMDATHCLLRIKGIRGFLYILNDLCFLRVSQLRLHSWQAGLAASDAGGEPIRNALESLEHHQRLAEFLDDLAHRLAEFDWRTSAGPGLIREEETAKAALRGSGGYRLLRLQLHEHLAKTEGPIGKAASEALRLLG